MNTCFYTDATRTTPIPVLRGNGTISNCILTSCTQAAEAYVYFPDISVTYSGTWRFVYDGVWETDGKAGWKPDYQISSNSNE